MLDADPAAARTRAAAGRRALGLRHVERRAGARGHRDQRGGADHAGRRARAARRSPRGRAAVVVSCVEQEWHALPALMVTEHLRAERLRGELPRRELLGAGPGPARPRIGPRAVLLSCSLSSFLPLARRQVEAVRETGTPGRGRRVRVRRRRTPGPGARRDGLRHRRDRRSATWCGRLPTAVPPAPPLTHPGAEEAFVVFGDRERSPTTSPGGCCGPLGGWTRHHERWRRVLEDQLPHLVGSIAGALVTDDPGVVARRPGLGRRGAAAPGRTRRHRSGAAATPCARRCTGCRRPPGCSDAGRSTRRS